MTAYARDIPYVDRKVNLERWAGREGLEDMQDLGNAREMTGQCLDYYNHHQLHAGIRYLRSVDYHSGDPDKLVNIRKDKLDKVRKKRKQTNQRRLNEENRSKQNCIT